MKIICKKLVNPGDENILTIGKEYLVLEILFIEEMEYQIICDDERPITLSINQFEITDGTIPKNWIVSYTKNGQLWISPARWADDSLWQYSFWEDYYGENDEKAKIVFEEEVAIMEAEYEFKTVIQK